MLSNYLKRKMTLAFYRFDTTKDGVVRVDDFDLLGQRVANNLGLAQGSDQYEKVVNEYRSVWDSFFKPADQDGDNTVTLEEHWAANERFLQQQQAAQIGVAANASLFAVLDADGNGQVTLKEYSAVVNALGASADEAATAF